MDMIGKVFDHYRITKKLGEGGMGKVYLADDLKLNRRVALKFLPVFMSENEEEKDRFKIEAQAAAALNHPNITQIYAIEEVDDQQFIVMEYVAGMELSEFIRSENPARSIQSKIAMQIADALCYAHKKGIIHRDIKSSNIMLDESGNVKIMDFGLAKILGSSQITKPGTTLGTMAYMSPEQITGQPVDQRSDIWSFGVVLYELFTGKLPYEAIYEQALMYSILEEEPQPASAVDTQVPEQVEHVINGCLVKDVQNRYAAFDEILTDLSELPVANANRHYRSTQRAIQKSWFKLRFLLIGFPVLLLAILVLFPSSIKKVHQWVTGTDRVTAQHILILPFKNIGGNSKDQALCDGLMETLSSKITELERFQGNLWVVPASEVQRYHIDSPGEANKTFGVNLAVTGSLQMLQGDARLTLNLVDAKKMVQLNSTVIDVSSKNLTLLQNSSVTKLLNMLNIELNPSLTETIRKGGTIVPGAYEFYLQGIAYLRRYEDESKIDNAIELFQEAIKADSAYALAYAALGEAYWRKYELNKDGRYVSKAKMACIKALKINNELAPVNVTMGLIALGTGQYNESTVFFNHALEVDPKDASAYRGLAKAYEARGSLDQAESTYRQAIHLKPDYWAGYNDLGVFYYRHSQYEKAIDQFKQVIQLTPDNYRGYSNLGGIYYMLQRWQSAREMFERSLSLKKTYEAASNLGTLDFIQGDYAGASKMYETALQLNQNDYNVWGNLAASYYWTPDERDKARPTYLKAIQMAEDYLKINPKNAAAVANLAGYYAEIGDRHNSLIYLSRSLKLGEKDPYIMFSAGATYEKLGKRNEALFWIERAIKNGYSKSEILNQPELKDLITDQRFKEVIKEYK